MDWLFEDFPLDHQTWAQYEWYIVFFLLIFFIVMIPLALREAKKRGNDFESFIEESGLHHNRNFWKKFDSVFRSIAPTLFYFFRGFTRNIVHGEYQNTNLLCFTQSYSFIHPRHHYYLSFLTYETPYQFIPCRYHPKKNQLRIENKPVQQIPQWLEPIIDDPCIRQVLITHNVKFLLKNNRIVFQKNAYRFEPHEYKSLTQLAKYIIKNLSKNPPPPHNTNYINVQ